METWHKKENHNIVVEAVLVNEDNVKDVAQWCKGELVEEIDPVHPQEMQWGINVMTAQDMQRASLGMYVIKFGKHFFVSHNRVFELAYQPTDRQSPPPQSIAEARRI